MNSKKIEKPQTTRTPGGSHLRRIALISAAVAAIAALTGPINPARAARNNFGLDAAFDQTRHADSGSLLGGIHLDVAVLPFLGVEGQVDYRSKENYGPGGFMPGSVSTTTVPVLLTGKLYLPAGSGWEPYFLAGTGWYRTTYDYSSTFASVVGTTSDTVQSFGWHLGLGTDLDLGSGALLSVAGRMEFNDPQRKLGTEVQQHMRDLKEDAYVIDVGLSHTFLIRGARMLSKSKVLLDRAGCPAVRHDLSLWPLRRRGNLGALPPKSPRPRPQTQKSGQSSTRSR